MKKGLLFITIVLSAFIGAVIGIMFSVRYLDIYSPTYNSIEQRQNLKFASLPIDSSRQILLRQPTTVGTTYHHATAIVINKIVIYTIIIICCKRSKSIGG